MKEDIRKKKEEDHIQYIEKEEKQQELMTQIVKMCKTNPWDYPSDSEGQEPHGKIDLSKFKDAYVVIKIKKDIKSNLEESR